ncbi:MAG TPA: alcohol dehydrogenase catalytic domain-containing protein [Nordella sp.]|nr:alcohol dehydrogenase catalytic domain-containing protein [Nordella sp.]
MIRQSLIAYGEPLAGMTATLPEPKGSEVLLKVAACGVCHSDLHLQDGHFDLGDGKRLDIAQGRQLPFTLGHEIAGHVEKAGPETGEFDRNRFYAVYPWCGCGQCERCRKGQEQLCDAPRHLGITVDGGYASHVLVPHPRYLIDAQGIDGRLAGSYMCSGLTAYSAIRKAERFLPQNGALLVVGLGGVGMMGLEIARALTEARLYAADVVAAKREAAVALGAAGTFDPAAANARRTVLKDAGPMDVAIDFVGSEASLHFAQSVVGKGGAVIIVGLMGGKFSLPVPMFPLRELTLAGSYVGSLEDARALLALVRQGRIRPIPVSERPLADANAALADLRAGQVSGRMILRP